MNKNKMNEQEILRVLVLFEGVIEMGTSTPLKMNKGGRNGVEPNPFTDRDVRKVKSGKYNFGKNYISMINESLAKQGKPAVTSEEYKLEALPWSEYEFQDKVIVYNGKRYLRCYPIKDEEIEETITIDGVPATQDELDIIKKYVPEKKMSKKQEEVGVTEENRIMPLAIAFENINYISLRFDIEH
jgi:hypothetical protein